MTNVLTNRVSSRSGPGGLPAAALLAGALVAWAAAVAGAGWAGLRPPTMAMPPLIATLAAAAALAGFLVPPLRRAATAGGVRGLTLMHAWRIAAGVGFLAAGSSGLLPRHFADVAGWGDIGVGVAALAFLPAVWRRPPRSAYLAFHALGLTDLFVAVGTALSVTLAGGDAMRAVTTLPISLIPLLGVPVTAAAHALAFGELWRARESSEKDSASVVAFPPAMTLIALASGAVMWLLLPAVHLLPWPVAAGAAVVCGVAALATFRAATSTLRRAKTTVHPGGVSTAVVRNGPFSFSRNPIYLSLTLLYVAATLALNSLWPLVPLVPLLLALHFGVVRREETYLSRKFGPAYDDYRRGVRRYL